MKTILSPRLKIKESQNKTLWLADGENYCLCLGALKRYFHIPKSAKSFWIEISNNSMSLSKKIKFRNEYGTISIGRNKYQTTVYAFNWLSIRGIEINKFYYARILYR